MTVHPTSQNFKENARQALADPQLQRALGHVKSGFIGRRQAAADRLPEFEELRDAARDIKDHTLAHLDLYLERYEAAVRGGGRARAFRARRRARRATSSSPSAGPAARRPSPRASR